MSRANTNQLIDEYEQDVDEIVAACDGDVRTALKALLLVNERLESAHPRGASRRRVLFAAAVEFGTTSISCIIRNISETGAAIEVNSPLWFPEQFTLRIDRDGTRRPCHIVWRRDKRIGLQFD